MTTLQTLSVKSLYALALAEGEGVGTAYEYYVKRLALRKWLGTLSAPPARMLVAGLPQQYGSSLDFLQLAAEFGAAVTVVDDRYPALNRARNSLAAAQQAGWLTAVAPTFITVDNLGALAELVQDYDLVISSEVVQRLNGTTRRAYINRVLTVGAAVALFVPNKNNEAHVGISGLDGLYLHELRTLLLDGGAVSGHNFQMSGYIDMPPFPPGITRSEDQRAQASSGLLEGVAMWGLGLYARLESLFPVNFRSRQSHIVYGFMRQS